MSNNKEASIQVLASGAGPGASTDIRLYAPPFTLTFKGATADSFRFDLSGDNVKWASDSGLARILTTNDDGEVSFVVPDDANYIRCECLAGNSGATASASITAMPLAANKPTAALTVANPGAFVDCRALGGPRTILFEDGASDDNIYIEGSDDGLTLPYQVYPTSGTTGRIGASWIATTQKLPNYMRCVQQAGSSTTARCSVVASPNTGAVGGDVLNGGQAGPVIVGTTDNTTVELVQNGSPVFLSDSTGTIQVTPGAANTLELLPAGGGAASPALEFGTLVGGTFVSVRAPVGPLIANPLLVLPGGVPVNTIGQTVIGRPVGPDVLLSFGPSIQSGEATLLATGISAAISANITATSRIFAFPKTFAGAGLATTTSYGALATDRVNGAPGSFKLTATDNTGAAVANNTSTLDWLVIDN